jgi:anti-anti-sigma factor
MDEWAGGPVPDDPTPDKLAITTATGAGEATIAVAGELDVRTSPLLRRAVEETLGSRPATVVLDVRGISFLDSYGIASLLGVRKLLAAHEVRLTVRCGTDTPAARLVAISGLGRVLDVR